MGSLDRHPKDKKKVWAILALTFFSAYAGILHAHKGEDHIDKEIVSNTLSTNEIPALKAINNEYLQTIKPIFQRSCMNCHGSDTQYPWYYSLPGAKKLIDYDIKESKNHLDMSNNFPFRGHGTPEQDLIAIRDSIQQGTMPPLRYQLLHWSSRIKTEEIHAIQNWVKSSIEKINNVKEEK
ncbi:MAG: heme-binding domain-containing protein [Bdellovibrionaceae bacterium]|nr:heme-binding domain-containing protein [Pseudobdellovibrionaceae bacterium]